MRPRRPSRAHGPYTAATLGGSSGTSQDATARASRHGPWSVTLDPFELKAALRAVLLPPAGPLLVALAGVWLMRRRPVAGRRLVIAGVALGWLLSTYLVASLLNRQVESGQRPLDVQRWEAARDGPAPPRAIVVLGGGAVVDGPFEPRRERLHGRTLERVVAGARLARATGLPLLVSGGRPDWLVSSEAELMRRVLEDDLGVPVRWVESGSRDTAENASMSAAMLRANGIGSIVLVTHAYHMARSQRAFERAGLVVLAAPHDWRGGRAEWPELRDLLPNAQAGELAWLAVHELVGGLWYRLRGHS
jgi:uncharacterized SAM-binding protein YcdF (DUF218 family)